MDVKNMMDIEKIMEFLPHRYPFLLVDRVLSIEEDGRLIAIKNVSANEGFFQGHFPGKPIMPGVLIIEALAQAAALLAYHNADEKKKVVYFMSIEKAKFRAPVVPGDQLRLEVKMLQSRKNVFKVGTEAYVGDKLVTQAELTAMMVDVEG